MSANTNHLCDRCRQMRELFSLIVTIEDCVDLDIANDPKIIAQLAADLTHCQVEYSKMSRQPCFCVTGS